jgi:maltooligosyltrehalose trehalohydrolase
MLFQGQEWNSSGPFLYFADHEPELAALVRAGRGEFLEQFPSAADPAVRGALADPADESTFRQCVLDWAEREANAHIVALHRDLIALRRSQRAFARQARRGVDGAVLGGEAFVLRFFDEEPGEAAEDEHCGDRLLLVNLGADLALDVVPEPLLAPPLGRHWRTAWSSEAPAYGGGGTPPVEQTQGAWRLPPRSAVVMSAAPGAPERGAHRRRTA